MALHFTFGSMTHFELSFTLRCDAYVEFHASACLNNWTAFVENFLHCIAFALLLKITQLGLLWWFGGKEATCQRKKHKFHPWSKKVPHASEQLSPWATATEWAEEPQLLSPCATTPEADEPRPHAPQKKSHCDEKPVCSNEDPVWPKIKPNKYKYIFLTKELMWLIPQT